MPIDIKAHQNLIIDYHGDGSKLRDIRIANGFTQKKIAELLGFADATVISQLENDKFGLDSRCYTLFCLLMDEHPTYQLKRKLKNYGSVLIEPPTTGDEIKKMRMNAKPINQNNMATLLGLNGKTMISKYENGTRKPSAPTWTVWLLIINQHPYYTINLKN